MGDPKAPRFVLWDEKLRAAPMGVLSLFGFIRAALGAVGMFKKPMPGGCAWGWLTVLPMPATCSDVLYRC